MALFLSKLTKTVRFFLAKYTLRRIKIFRSHMSEKTGKKETKNAANLEKWLAAELSGVPEKI